MVRFGFLVLSVTLLLSATASAQTPAGQNAQGVRTIIIDAGHGGARYPGARYGGLNEKDINLAVALRLGGLIEQAMPEINVIYTRTVEKMFSSVLSEDLQARADIANEAHGDLFISIHSNAARNSQTCGTETLIMGETPMETTQNENILFANNREEFLDMSDERTAAVVRAYIQNLQFTYGEYSEAMARLVQKHFARIGRRSRGVRHQPLKVLYATDMPSILTEIGFMSNPDELKYITSDVGQKQIAGAIFGAIVDYIDYVRATQNTGGPASDMKPSVPEAEEAAPAQAVPEAASSPSAVSHGTAEDVAVNSRPNQEPKTEPNAGVERSYSIQVLASRTRVGITRSTFGDYSPSVREIAGQGTYRYKYCIGSYSTRQSAQSDLARVRERFGGAFLVEVTNGVIR